MTHGSPAIRRAVVTEAPALTDIAFAAKRHWGYSPQTMELWRRDLTITADTIESNATFVYEDDRILGFYTLSVDQQEWELEHLWVLPQWMRQGIGKALLTHAAATVGAGRGRVLRIDADPNAEPFYLACGAQHIGNVAAPIPSQPNRMRPILELDVAGLAPATR
jgi:GNAT superfamily N-acetyltransferase